MNDYILLFLSIENMSKDELHEKVQILMDREAKLVQGEAKLKKNQTEYDAKKKELGELQLNLSKLVASIKHKTQVLNTQQASLVKQKEELDQRESLINNKYKRFELLESIYEQKSQDLVRLQQIASTSIDQTHIERKNISESMKEIEAMKKKLMEFQDECFKKEESMNAFQETLTIQESRINSLKMEYEEELKKNNEEDNEQLKYYHHHMELQANIRNEYNKLTNYQKELIQSTELYSQELDEINEKLVRLQEKEEGFYKKSEELMQSEKLFIEEKEQFEERQKNRENELERKEKELKTQEEKMNQTAKEVIEKFDMIKGYQSLVEIQSKYDEIMANIQEKKEELVKMMKVIMFYVINMP